MTFTPAPLGHPATTGLAAVISELMVDRGLSARALSKLTHIPRTTLDRSLAGARALDTNELFAVAYALEVLPDDLIATARAAA